jgi:hypothetical protein
MPDCLAFLCGLPDSGQVWITQLQPATEFRWDGTACFLSHVIAERPCVRIWVGPAAPTRVTLEPGPVVNYIADPDLCVAALSAASRVAHQLPWPVFNHPDRIRATSRDLVSETLQGIPGIRVPKVIRCRPGRIEDIQHAIVESGIDYPVLVRAVGSHRGLTLARIDRSDDTPAFEAWVAAGCELYICPFVDFADGDGLYRKHRVAMIGGQPFLNSLVTAAHWNVHASSRIWNGATIAAERAAVDGFTSGLGARLGARLREIHRRLGLDYFGIDFAMTPDGAMLIFEANAVMDVMGPSPLTPDIWVRSGQAIKAALLALLDQPQRWVEAARTPLRSEPR